MHILASEDLQSDEGIGELVRMMYAHQEKDFYLFLEQSRPENRTILDRLEAFGVLPGASEFYYYKHPAAERHYVRIQTHNIKWDWQKEVVAKGPMFVRTALKLSQAMIRGLEIEEKIAVEGAQNLNPLDLKPNFFGIGLDLSKLWKWANSRVRKRG